MCDSMCCVVVPAGEEFDMTKTPHKSQKKEENRSFDGVRGFRRHTDC